MVHLWSLSAWGRWSNSLVRHSILRMYMYNFICFSFWVTVRRHIRICMLLWIVYRNESTWYPPKDIAARAEKCICMHIRTRVSNQNGHNPCVCVDFNRPIHSWCDLRVWTRAVMTYHNLLPYSYGIINHSNFTVLITVGSYPDISDPIRSSLVTETFISRFPIISKSSGQCGFKIMPY